MNRVKGLGILSLAIFLGLAAEAQRDPGTPPVRPRQIAQVNGQKNPNRPYANKGARRPGRKLGDWLREHRNLPPDQQEKLLESDPAFKNLPPERQAEMKQRLRNFNSLTPRQQDGILRRMDFLDSLSEDQRRELREAHQKMESLPPDRQLVMHKAVRHLSQMDPEQRQQVLNSERFKSMFSDDERGILTKLSAIAPPDEGNPNQPGPPKDAPK